MGFFFFVVYFLFYAIVLFFVLSENEECLYILVFKSKEIRAKSARENKKNRFQPYEFENNIYLVNRWMCILK